MPGMTGFFGLMEVGVPKAGETVVTVQLALSANRGANSLLKGCRVVGIAGGRAKCDWVVNELPTPASTTKKLRRAKG
jgi:hypothetical protein